MLRYAVFEKTSTDSSQLISKLDQKPVVFYNVEDIGIAEQYFGF